MKKNIILIVFLCFFVSIVYSHNYSDSQIVNEIANILILEYDNYKDKTFTEKLVLKLGKRAFIDSVLSWKQNYDCLDTMKIKLHYQLVKMAKIGQDNLPPDVGQEFRNLLTDLTRIGYKNLDIYYRGVKKVLRDLSDDSFQISLSTIDQGVADLEFYEEKIAMYDEEQRIKDRMREIMKMKEIKYKIAFYSFAFEFVDKIRVKVIAQDLEKVRVNMELKNLNEKN